MAAPGLLKAELRPTNKRAQTMLMAIRRTNTRQRSHRRLESSQKNNNYEKNLIKEIEHPITICFYNYDEQGESRDMLGLFRKDINLLGLGLIEIFNDFLLCLSTRAHRPSALLCPALRGSSACWSSDCSRNAFAVSWPASSPRPATRGSPSAGLHTAVGSRGSRSSAGLAALAS